MSVNCEKRLADYFVVCGLDLNSGLEPDQLAGDSLHCTPLDRPFRSKVLAHYPESLPSNPFDEQSVGMLCLPKGLSFRTQKHKHKPEFHSFIKTREDGSRTYGHCYTFYEEVKDRKIYDAMHTLQNMFLAELSGCNEDSHKRRRFRGVYESGGSHSLPRSLKSKSFKSGALFDMAKDTLYVTKCICLVTQLPVVFVCRKFLEGLYNLVVNRDVTGLPFESYVYNILYEVPLPPPGRSMKFSCFGQQLMCQRPGPNEIPFFDYSFEELFRTLTIDNIIQLFTSVLLEYQVLLFSGSYNKLMLVAECITILLFPFKWHHVYAPILPTSLHHFLDAPVPFVMGLQHTTEDVSHLSILGQANLCFVDIDNRIVVVPEEIPMFPCRKELLGELQVALSSYGVSVGKAELDNSRKGRRLSRKLSLLFDPESGLCLNDISDMSNSLDCTNNQICNTIEHEERFSKTTDVGRCCSNMECTHAHICDAVQQVEAIADMAGRTDSADSLDTVVPLLFRKTDDVSFIMGSDERQSNCNDNATVTSDSICSTSNSSNTSTICDTTEISDMQSMMTNDAIEKTREDMKKHLATLKFNNAIREIFLNRFVHMFASYESFVIQPKQEDMEQWPTTRETMQNFDKTAFLSDQPEPYLPFISRFIETQMFASFIDNKIISFWEEMDPCLKIFESRIRILSGDGSNCSDRSMRVPIYEPCETYRKTEILIEKRACEVDVVAPPPKPVQGINEVIQRDHVPGFFPVLNQDILNDQSTQDRGPKSMCFQKKKTDRLNQNIEHHQMTAEQKEKLKEARNNGGKKQGHIDVPPAMISQTHWKFVLALLKECKVKTKRMLVAKMGQEAVELGHNEMNIIGVEENTLIASLCDLLERIWAHGLHSKQGKSALWLHLSKFLEEEEKKHPRKFLSPVKRPEPIWNIGLLLVKSPALSSFVQHLVNFDELPRMAPKYRFAPKPFQTGELEELPISLASDIKNVQMMSEIKTDIGYARAFVRLALEKKFLYRHFKMLTAEKELLKPSYKRYAFLRCDDEKEQFLCHLLSLNAVDYHCFTNTFTSITIPYRILVFPSTRTSASRTSANPWIMLSGTLGETKLMALPRQKLELLLKHKNLGILTTVRIGHDNMGLSPNWMVEHVLVRNEITGHTYKFPCGRWLGKSVDDGSTERLLCGELMPRDCAARELMELCRTPPRCRSPSVPRRPSEPKLSLPEMQQMLGDAVNNIIKYYYKPEKERGNLTSLLCGESGLVYCMEQVFMYGFKFTRFFKQLYLWDYFVKVKDYFSDVFGEQEQQHAQRISETSTINEKLFVIQKYCHLIYSISNEVSSTVGKDGKFQIFICLALRDHLLHQMMVHIADTPVTTTMYEEQSFLRNPALVAFLVEILQTMSEFNITLETSLTKGIGSVYLDDSK